MTDRDPIADTRRWLDRAVIGLNLCPFAKAVVAKDQVRFVLSDATDPAQLLAELDLDPALAAPARAASSAFALRVTRS